MNKFLLLLVFVGVAWAVPTFDKHNKQQEKDCKQLCGGCNCNGFYCGEECICECVSDDRADIRCIEAMESNCKKLKFPFEVLIQGRSGRRFIRDSMDIDDDDSIKSPRAISIYKPKESDKMAKRKFNGLIKENMNIKYDMKEADIKRSEIITEIEQTLKDVEIKLDSAKQNLIKIEKKEDDMVKKIRVTRDAGEAAEVAATADAEVAAAADSEVGTPQEAEVAAPQDAEVGTVNSEPIVGAPLLGNPFRPLAGTAITVSPIVGLATLQARNAANLAAIRGQLTALRQRMGLPAVPAPAPVPAPITLRPFRLIRT